MLPPPRRVEDNLTVVDHFPKIGRYTLGVKVDDLFIDCLSHALRARYSNGDVKYQYIDKLVISFDSLKFFLQVLWDLKILDNSKYSYLSQHLAEIGKMIGGWQKYVKKETPPN